MVKRKLFSAYQAVHRRSRRHLYQRPYILPIFGLLIGGLIVLGVVFFRNGDTLHVSDFHIVYLFDKGQRQTLDTKAQTVGDLVKRLPLDLRSHDVVEPSLDTKIVEDNYRVNIYRARPVTVIDGQHKTVTLTAQRSARVVAQDAGLKVLPEDVASFTTGNIKNNTIGEEVLVRRSIPVTLVLYGETLQIHTVSKTVSELLTERNIILRKGDYVRPKMNVKIRRGLQIFVLRNGVKIVTQQEKIPFPVQYVTDSSLSLGATAVRQNGVPGRQAVTYQVITKNGRIKRKVLQKVIVEKPVPQIVARGNIVDVAGNKQQIMAAAGISSSDYGYVNFVISHESNWNPGARNPGGCLGLGQACPGSKLTAVCSLSDPVCQLRYFSGYAHGRYGGWGGAYNFWLGHGYW